MPSILMAHISETPILPGTPLPLFSPEVVMEEPYTPHPGQEDHDPRPPPIILSQRVSCIVMNEHDRYHCPIRVNHLHHQQQQKLSTLKQKVSELKEEEKGKNFTQWLDWMRPMTQKSTLTLKKKTTFANSRGW